MTKVEVRQNEESGAHELGAEIDGTWIPFSSVSESDVTSRREALAAHEAANPKPADAA